MVPLYCQINNKAFIRWQVQSNHAFAGIARFVVFINSLSL